MGPAGKTKNSNMPGRSPCKHKVFRISCRSVGDTFWATPDTCAAASGTLLGWFWMSASLADVEDAALNGTEALERGMLLGTAEQALPVEACTEGGHVASEGMLEECPVQRSCRADAIGMEGPSRRGAAVC